MSSKPKVMVSLAGVPKRGLTSASRYGISVRDGLFCAHPLSRHLVQDASNRSGTWFSGAAVRASIGLGTTVEHVDRLITALKALTSAR